MERSPTSSARAATGWWWSRPTRASWSATGARRSARCAPTRTRSSTRRGCASVLAVGQSLPFRRGGSVSLPLDVSRTLESLLDRAAARFRPRARAVRPERGVGGAAPLAGAQRRHVPLDHRALRLHPGGPQGRGAPVRPPRRPHGQLQATRDLVERYFPGDYHVIRPGADPLGRPHRRRRPARDRLLGRGGARGAAAVPAGAPPAARRPDPWRATIWLRDPASAPGRQPLAPAARARRRRAPRTGRRRSSSRARRSPWRRRQAPRRRPARAARARGRRGPGGRPPPGVRGGAARRRARAAVRAARLAHAGRPARAPDRPSRTCAPPTRSGSRQARPRLEWSRAADEFEELYGGSPRAATSRRQRRRCAGGSPTRGFIHVDLHMHTDHSPDCATPVEHAARHRERGRAGARSR